MTQFNAFPTSEDLHRCQSRLYDDSFDPASVLSPAYTVITQAGSGTFGDVYFCLRSSIITTVHNIPKTQADLKVACNDLTKQLVAIKICQGTSVPTLCNEVAVLQIITTTNQAATRNAACGNNTTSCDAFFLSLHQAPCPDQDAHYLTTTTLALVCSLDALLLNTQDVPEPLKWLVYLKISRALEWLTKHCKPGIAHGDLHPGNILLGYPTLDPEEHQQLPQVKLIDFGSSRVADAEPGFEFEYAILYNQTVRRDQSAFLHILAVMMDVMSFDRRSRSRSPRRGSRGRAGSGAELGEFRKCVQRAVKRSSWDHEECLVELERRFGEFAQRRVGGVRVKECEVVWGAVMRVTEVRGGRSRSWCVGLWSARSSFVRACFLGFCVLVVVICLLELAALTRPPIRSKVGPPNLNVTS